MADFKEAYIENHRRQQLMVLGVSFVFLLLAAAPRQERVLFITDGLGIKAFGANLAPPEIDDAVRYSMEFPPFDVPRKAYFVRTPRRPTTGAASPFGPLTPTGPNAFAPAASAEPEAPAGAPGDVVAPVATIPPGPGFPFAPPSFGPPPSSVAAPVPTATPPVTTPTPPATSPVIVPGVPEPSAWLMLIGGFAVIGLALRRRREKFGRDVRV